MRMPAAPVVLAVNIPIAMCDRGHLPLEVIPMGVSARYRDKGDEVSRKHGDTLIGTLRSSYGRRFAEGCTDGEKLSEALAKLDGQSLSKLVRDHEAGMLSIRLRTCFAGQR